MFEDILGKYSESVKIDIELCKRNYKRTKLGYLNCYNKKITKRFGNIDEIEFTINKHYEKNGKIKVNPYYMMVEGKAILKVSMLDGYKYFAIKDVSESKGESKKVNKQVIAYSYEYTFNEKIIRSIKDVYKLYDTTDIKKSILHEVVRLNPSWKIGYVNPDVNSKYRTMSVDEQSLLDFIYDLQKTFGCYVEFNTVSKTINVHKIEDIGTNKGLVLNERNYTNSLEIKPNYDDVVTRLWAYGKDDISINAHTTGGQSYVEMYDYYMSNPNMVDGELVTAYNTYQELLVQKQGEFNTLLEQLKTKFKEMSALNSEMAKLKAELKKIKDQIDVAINSMSEPDSPTSLDLSALNDQEKEAQGLVDAKQAEIDAKQAEIDAVNVQIENLRKSIAGEANFTEDQLMSLNEITFEKVFRDTNIGVEKDLYEKVVKELPKMAQPKISFEINLVNFLKCLEHQANWDKVLFGLGDFVNIENELLPKNIAVRLIEFTFMEDGIDFDMKFSNKDSLDDPMAFFEELGKKVNSSSITLDINKFTYGKYEEKENEIMDYINNDLDLSTQQILSNKANVVINDRGITLTSPSDSNNQLRMLSGLIAFTTDSWSSCKCAIKSAGITAELLIGKILLGNRLVIENSDSSFVIDDDNLTIRDGQQNKKVILGKYEKTPTPKWGLKIFGSKGENDVVLDDTGMLQTWQDSTYDNVASGKPLKINLFVPETTKSIKEAKLRFHLDYFRGFSTSVADGGGTTSSSGLGGSYTSSGGGSDVVSTTVSILNVLPNGSGETHNHGLPEMQIPAYAGVATLADGTQVLKKGSFYNYQPSGDHRHEVRLSISNHYHSLPSFSHTHTISSHSHNTSYGIYESSEKPRNVEVYVNNSKVGSTYNSDQSNIDIANKLIIGQWNEIQISSTSNGRIEASVFIQCLMGI